MEVTLLAVTTVLTNLATTYLQYSPLYTDGQRVWGEWAAWGAIALACRHHSRKSTSKGDESDKEAQSQPKFTNSRVEKPAIVLSLLLIASFCVSIRFPDQKLQWTYVSADEANDLIL